MVFFIAPVISYGEITVDERKAKLRSDLAQLEKDIDSQKQIIQQKQNEGVSLERDIAILNAKIQSSTLSIQARILSIQKLDDDISDKVQIIGALSAKLNSEKESLAQILRQTRELNDTSLIEFGLSSKTLSSFFSDADKFSILENALAESFQEIVSTQNETTDQKNQLEDKKAEEVALRKLQELERQRLSDNKKQKDSILAQTRGQEKAYTAILKQKEKSAAQIRAELFSLQGSKAISFGDALSFAKSVGAKTGVRPALILGILREETNLGANVGTGNWKVDMHPTRDQPIFAQITAELGYNPDTMPVSKKAWYGWGGAMGPAQFIPSTWVLYKDKISQVTGNNPPDPWKPEDAFTAAALLLKDNGAAKGTIAAERFAALCYLAGCKNATKKAYSFYADDVLDFAAQYEAQMKILQNGS